MYNLFELFFKFLSSTVFIAFFLPFIPILFIFASKKLAINETIFDAKGEDLNLGFDVSATAILICLIESINVFRLNIDSKNQTAIDAKESIVIGTPIGILMLLFVGWIITDVIRKWGIEEGNGIKKRLNKKGVIASYLFALICILSTFGLISYIEVNLK